MVDLKRSISCVLCLHQRKDQYVIGSITTDVDDIELAVLLVPIPFISPLTSRSFAAPTLPSEAAAILPISSCETIFIIVFVE